ncbi:MAG: heme-binding domain-containing protein [Bacteroidetes bacterium]|nr:heme-binding domain-containing protein [Bacteroidota bacterium]
MKRSTKILIAVAIILVAIQFIRPAKNDGNAYAATDVTHVINTSEEVKQILATSCNDCHSNHTTYPWYNNIQPVAGWLGHHIDEGKGELNLTEFANYPVKKQIHKLEETAEMVREGEMPLSSYLWVHGDAKLSPEQRELLAKWAEDGMKQLSATAPN